MTSTIINTLPKKYIQTIISDVQKDFATSITMEAAKKYIGIALVNPNDSYSKIVLSCIAGCEASIEEDGPHFYIPSGSRFEEEANYHLESGDYKMVIELNNGIDRIEKTELDLSTQLGKYMLFCILNNMKEEF